MELKRVSLVLADISGYTRFMNLHSMSLLHAETIITELLEAVIDKAEHPLTLSKLEGDATFLYAESGDDEAAATRDVLRQVASFFEVFKAKMHALMECDGCICDACRNMGQLKLKAFLHHGEVAVKKIRQFEELAGADVILIHRLMKNTVPAKEYILLTQKFFELSGGLAEQTPEARTEDCEGIGPVPVVVYYPVGDEAPLPARPVPAPPQPGTEFYAFANRTNGHAMRRLLGLKPRSNFAHLPDEKISFWDYWVTGLVAQIRAASAQKNK
jgi:class 3 adenylate cyclase